MLMLDLREKEESHFSQEYVFYPVCVRLCLSKVDFWEKEESYISKVFLILGKGRVTYFTGICLLSSCVLGKGGAYEYVFILCVFAYVYPKLIFGKRRSHIFHRNMASILCVFAYAYPKLIFGKRKSHIFHRNMSSILCVFAYAYPKLIFGKRRSHIFHRNMLLLSYVC